VHHKVDPPLVSSWPWKRGRTTGTREERRPSEILEWLCTWRRHRGLVSEKMSRWCRLLIIVEGLMTVSSVQARVDVLVSYDYVGIML
jgi:hypothetical protein